MDPNLVKSVGELGFAIGIASYLVWFITNRVVKTQDKIVELLNKIMEILS